MNKQLIIVGIVVLLLVGGLSGCISTKNPVSKGNVVFTVEDVLITNELEVFDYWKNETKIEVSNDTNFVIFSIRIENKEDKWLTVQASIFGSLTDDEGNEYTAEYGIRINGSYYSLEKLSLIDEGEPLDISEDISSNSTVLKKIVYEIPRDREPEKLKLSYGFKNNELTNVEKWYHITFYRSTIWENLWITE